MKKIKLLLASLCIFCIGQLAHAENVFWHLNYLSTTYGNFTLLKDWKAGYYHDFKFNIDRAGVSTQIVEFGPKSDGKEYFFLGVDGGIAAGVDSEKKTAGFIGGGVKTDVLINYLTKDWEVSPQTIWPLIVPSSMQGFINGVYLNVNYGYDFNERQSTFAYFVGLEKSF